MEELHEKFMSRCIHLADLAVSQGNPPVGSVLVFENRLIGEGIESGRSTGDITNHAEILAIKDAIAKGNLSLLSQAVLYSTHEPCIMCSYVIRHYQIPHIVYSVDVDHIGGFSSSFAVLQTEAVPKWGKKPKVTRGISKTECSSLPNKTNPNS